MSYLLIKVTLVRCNYLKIIEVSVKIFEKNAKNLYILW